MRVASVFFDVFVRSVAGYAHKEIHPSQKNGINQSDIVVKKKCILSRGGGDHKIYMALFF